MDETNTPKGEKFLKETGTVMRYKTLYKTKYDVELILVNFSQKKNLYGIPKKVWRRPLDGATVSILSNKAYFLSITNRLVN